MSLAGFYAIYCTANLSQIHKDVIPFIWYPTFICYLAQNIPRYLQSV